MSKCKHSMEACPHCYRDWQEFAGRLAILTFGLPLLAFIAGVVLCLSGQITRGSP